MSRPDGGRWWRDHAAQLISRYPLMVEDWDQHHECVRTGFYSVHIRTETTAPAAGPDCVFADEPPLSPEEEEAWAARAAAPAQMELF